MATTYKLRATLTDQAGEPVVTTMRAQLLNYPFAQFGVIVSGQVLEFDTNDDGTLGTGGTGQPLAPGNYVLTWRVGGILNRGWIVQPANDANLEDILLDSAPGAYVPPTAGSEYENIEVYDTVVEAEAADVGEDVEAIFVRELQGWFIISTQALGDLIHGTGYITTLAGDNFVTETQVTA